MKRFILITTVLAALCFTACQKTPDVNVSPSMDPALTTAPIATNEAVSTAEAGATPEITLGPSVTAEASASPEASATASAKGMLDNAPAFVSGGKFIDTTNDEDIGLLQVEDVTEKEFTDYIDLLLASGFEGELDSTNSEMRCGSFTDGTFEVNVTYTVQSGYPTEFLLCVSTNE